MQKLVRNAVKKTTSLPSDSELLRKGLAAQMRRLPGGAGDPDHRIVIGEVDVPDVGRVHVEHDQAADEVVFHGVRGRLADFDADLRNAFCAGTAAFVEAQNAAEQVTARTLVGLVVTAIIQRHDKFIGATVRQRALSARYDV
jgi:hypothetical protein